MRTDTANAIWDVLVADVGAREKDRDTFVRYLTDESNMFGSWEYRFMGTLGFGGKLHYNEYRGAYISCYPEHVTPESAALIAAVDEQLREIAPGERS